MLAMRLEEEHEIWERATAPGRLENAALSVARYAAGGAVVMFIVGLVQQSLLPYGLTALLGLAVASVWLCIWDVKRGQRRVANSHMWNPVRADLPGATRLAVFVFRPQFEPRVFDNGQVIEVTLDPFVLNAAERDYEFEDRLDSAQVQYERLDDYTARLTHVRPSKPLSTA